MSWSMMKDRKLIKLADGRLGVDAIAKLLDTFPAQIVKASRRLGISLRRKPPMEAREPKAKGK
jgi:hypothetical protein